MDSNEYKKMKLISKDASIKALENAKRRKTISEKSDIAIESALLQFEEQKKFIENAIKEKMSADPKMKKQETVFEMKELMKLYKDICDSQMNVISKQTSKEAGRISAKKSINKKTKPKEEEGLEQREELKGFLSNMNFVNKA